MERQDRGGGRLSLFLFNYTVLKFGPNAEGDPSIVLGDVGVGATLRRISALDQQGCAWPAREHLFVALRGSAILRLRTPLQAYDVVLDGSGSGMVVQVPPGWWFEVECTERDELLVIAKDWERQHSPSVRRPIIELDAYLAEQDVTVIG